MTVRILTPQRKTRSVGAPTRAAVARTLASPGQGAQAMLRQHQLQLPGFDLSRVRIHADSQAADSARLLSARGYTVSNHVALDSRRFPLTTAIGRHVFAHELVHAAGMPESATVPDTVSEPHDGTERAASEIARCVVSHEPLPATPTSSGQARSAVQRDLLAYSREHLETLPSMGDDGGSTSITYAGDAGAIRTALEPLIRAGTVSARTTAEGEVFSAMPAARGAVQTALAGFARPADMATAMVDGHQLSVYSNQRVTKYHSLWPVELDRKSNVIERQSQRPLTASERAEAALVFGPGLNYDQVQLSEDPVMSVGGYARTTPWTINFPTGSFGGSGFMPWLIHELMHSWQYQHGISLATTLYHSIASSYDYGGEAGLSAATAAGRRLRSFNTEQQGDIARDYYRRSKAGLPTTAWDPFIAELRAP